MKKQSYSRLLVVTDGMKTSEAAHQTALNLAKTHDSEVMLVDTVQSPGTAARWFTPNAGDVFEMVVADKQQRLEKVAENFRDRGIQTETKVLFGKSSEVITQEAIAWDASLVVRYMKGVRSKFPGIFGNTARNLMRICPTPILLVGSEPIDEPRVLACIDVEHSDKENSAIVDESFRLAGEKQRLLGLYCWEMYSREMMEERMNETSFRESLDYAESMYRKSLDKFEQAQDLSAFAEGIRMENGDPSQVIPDFCKHEKIDVVVMCNATLNHPLKRHFGSTVESAIDSLPCSLMVVKPVGFVSPVSTVSATVDVWL